MFVPAINIWNYSRPTIYWVDGKHRLSAASYTSDLYRCSLPLITRALAIVADVLVLYITWKKSAYTWRTSLRIRQFKPKISILLLRDGTIYFVALFIANFVTLLLDIFSRQDWVLDGATNLMYLTEAIAPTLIARFLLDLRSVYHAEYEPTTGHQLSIMQFASGSVMGNLAAPITDSTWTTGQGDDVDSDQANKREEAREPFLAGLVPDSPQSDLQLELDNLRRNTDFFTPESNE
ncbi:hypothetical protein EIP91_006346 [Steccherinum ochraceum]|uniref:Uncharacterized protein n=1 Tax=Steccherinum ochraceum TaxID=92696 RepID=A0A4R0R8K6_9APHY|nr:hypothetical protein EIP91_006346 [Steccherinum ochraceum]